MKYKIEFNDPAVIVDNIVSLENESEKISLNFSEEAESIKLFQNSFMFKIS